MLKFLSVILSAGLLSFTPASCQNQTNKQKDESTTASTETPKVGEAAEEEEESDISDNSGVVPNEKLPSVKLFDINKKPVDLLELTKNGKTTVISFWANWCGPCKRELNSYNKLYKKWESDYNVQFFAISMDDKDVAKNLKNIVSGYDWTFPVYWDAEKEGVEKFNITGIPYMIIVNKNGTIVKKQTGYNPADEAKLEKMLQELK